ncbi:MAG: TolC family protein [Planctomycetes bacterium]|nr:TolC family protein [Planctomycetota bacterium]
MRKLTFLPLLAALASCGSDPEPVTPWRYTDWRRVDAACGRFPDWSDGLSLEELLVCVERRGAVPVARELTREAEVRIEGTRSFPSFPFEVSGVRPSQSDVMTTSGATVRHVFDYNRRWEKRQAAMTAEIALARENADDLLCRVRDIARCAYWSAVAAENRLGVERRRAIEPDRPHGIGPGGDTFVVAPESVSGELRMAEWEASSARRAVETLVGTEAPPSWTLTDSFPDDRPEVDLTRAIAMARLHSTSLAALAASADETRSRLDQAEADDAPDPGIGVAYSVERDRNSASFDFHDSESSGFIGFSMNLPPRGHGRRTIVRVTAEARATMEARNAAEAEVERDVTDAVRRYQGARGSAARASSFAAHSGVDAELEFAVARSRLEALVGRPVEEYSRGRP